ncbi:MAG: tetratricopeptide repeat protein [Myxococcales bacterium]|nr:tetratricopeptide repeat protein [Myxococcales bacterium]
MGRLATCCLAVSVAWGSVACAQDGAPAAEDAESEAREAYLAGAHAAEEGRWSEAIALYQRALSLVERPNMYRNLGVAYENARRYVEAEAAFARFVELTDEEAERAAFAERLEAVRARIATIQLRVAPGTARIELDGRPVDGEGEVRELRVDPGPHRLDATAEGYLRGAAQSVALTEGQVWTVSFELVAAPIVADPEPAAPPSRGDDAAAIALLVGGGVTFAGGAVLFGVGRAFHDDVQDLPDGARWAEYQARYDATEGLQIAGAVLGGVGLAAAAVGVLLLVLEGEPARAEVAVGPGGVLARARF